MYNLARAFQLFLLLVITPILLGCVSVPVAQPVKKIEFPKYGFVIDEPSWNSLNCNEQFMLYADEAKAMKSTKIRYDMGYLFVCNSIEKSSQRGPDVRIGWKDTDVSQSEVLRGIISEIGNAYFGETGTKFTFQCRRVDEVLNPLFIGRSHVCSVKRDSAHNSSYTISIFFFKNDKQPNTENWVLAIDAFNHGVATESWLKKAVETARPTK
jgi:hypothetical protein